jgi:hypothetical protein
LGSCERLSAFRDSERSDGPIFAAHPHVRASPVSVFFLKNFIHLFIRYFVSFRNR